MIANQSEFDVLLERYEDDPGVCSKLLRNSALAQPSQFLRFSQTAIAERPVSRVLKFIAGLAISAGIIPVLLDTFSTNRQAAGTLAKRLLECEPRFDVMLADYLLQPTPGITHDESIYHAVLDLLDQISESDLLVPNVLKLLKHANPKVRSKAALFVGSRTQNMAWAARGTQEFDARVRANIIESLFGLNSEFVIQMFRNHVSDENNRVAGNAVYGLYQLGEVESIAKIYDLGRHPEARFRNTAAWLMGKTGDPRFSASCLELMNDADEIVRAQAFKGLGELRKAMRAAASLPQFRASVIQVKRNERETAIVTVTEPNGEPVRRIQPIHFIVKAGHPSKPLREFAVEEYESRTSLNVGFVLCLPVHASEALERSFVDGLQGLTQHRRSKDRWSVVKINGRVCQSRVDGMAGTLLRTRQKWAVLNVNASVPTAVAPFEPKFEYSNTESRLEQMIHDNPLTLSEVPAEDAARVIDNLSRVDIASGRPTWIVVGAGDKGPLLTNLLDRGQELEAVVNVLALSEEWNKSGRMLANQTNGMFELLTDASCVKERMQQIYRSLVHHYRVSWPISTSHVEIDIHSKLGRASAAENPQERDDIKQSA